MKIGLYFGSFNPIHIGHLIVADSLLNALQLSQVWMVVSPQNPFKKQNELADEMHRLKMVDLSLENHPQLKSSDIEFKLPKPSYTIDTLKSLHEHYSGVEFSLIMGSDNLIYFHKWKEFEKILELIHINVYARETKEEIPQRWKNHPKISIHPLPLINVSSTKIREKITNEESIKYWVRDEVEQYIFDHQLYSSND